jgi:hypothetical protein
MTASDVQTEVWKPIPGASYYEASDRGRVRSINRTINGRAIKGAGLTPKRTGTSPYWEVKLTDDTGRQRTRPVHQLVLEAHVGLCPPGQEGCHGDDNKDHNDAANLRWDWPPANDADRRRNHPPPPPREKPEKTCIVCGAKFRGRNSPRCHLCVVAIGVLAARLLESGVRLKAAAEQVGYPVTVDGLDGLLMLAQRHGGYGLTWSRRVRARLSAWLAGGDAL